MIGPFRHETRLVDAAASQDRTVLSTAKRRLLHKTEQF